MINVATLTGIAGSYTLTNSGNTIAQVGGGTLQAATGTLAIVDTMPLTVAGTVQASTGNVFLHTTPGNALTVDGAISSQTGGTIGIQADSVAGIGVTSPTGGVNTNGGVFELAPASAAAETLGLPSGLSLTNTGGIATGTLLRIGAITLPGSASPTTTATSIAVAGPFGAGNQRLELDANGPVTETGSLTDVPALTGTAASFTLIAPGNQIGQLGQPGGSLTATGGTIAIIDTGQLTLAGVIHASAGDIFLSTSGGPIGFTAGGSLVSMPGGIIGIQADALSNLGTTGATGVVDAGANGWFELAPASAAIETLGAASALSLTNLTGITAGTLRIGAVTLPASPAPFVSATSIAVAGTFNAASIAVLDLEATGTISQATTAPIINLASLIASTNGVPGDIVLADTSNVIGTIGNIGVTAGNFVFGDTPASGTFAVSSGQMIFANNVSMTIVGTLAVNGAVTAAGTPGDVSLSARGPVADLIVGTGASLAAKGTMSVASDQDVMQSGGVINGGAVTVTAGGLLSLGATVSGAAIGLTGANIAIAGSVTDGGAGTVGLFATGGTISETGTLIAGTLTGSSTGAATLAGATPGTNLVTSLGSFLAPSFHAERRHGPDGHRNTERRHVRGDHGQRAADGERRRIRDRGQPARHGPGDHGPGQRWRHRNRRPDRDIRHDRRDRHADRRDAVGQRDRGDNADRRDADREPGGAARRLHRGGLYSERRREPDMRSGLVNGGSGRDDHRRRLADAGRYHDRHGGEPERHRAGDPGTA